jgi:hypothetical protein
MPQEKGACQRIDPLIGRNCSPEEEAANMLAAADVRRSAGIMLLVIAVVCVFAWSFDVVKSYLSSSDTHLYIESYTKVEQETKKPESVASMPPKQGNPLPDMTRDSVPEQVLIIMRDVDTEGEVSELPASCDRVVSLLEDELMPKWMVYVAWRESRCTPDAKRLITRTGDQSFGYFQINTLDNLWPEVQRLCGVTERHTLLDPETNVGCAAALYRRYGYKPWHSGVYFTAP